MLQSYHAKIHHSHIEWLDKVPVYPDAAEVLIVFDTGKPQLKRSYSFTDLAGKLTWQGDAPTVQRALRDAW